MTASSFVLTSRCHCSVLMSFDSQRAYMSTFKEPRGQVGHGKEKFTTAHELIRFGKRLLRKDPDGNKVAQKLS